MSYLDLHTKCLKRFKRINKTKWWLRWAGVVQTTKEAARMGPPMHNDPRPFQYFILRQMHIASINDRQWPLVRAKHTNISIYFKIINFIYLYIYIFLKKTQSKAEKFKWIFQCHSLSVMPTDLSPIYNNNNSFFVLVLVLFT